MVQQTQQWTNYVDTSTVTSNPLTVNLNDTFVNAANKQNLVINSSSYNNTFYGVNSTDSINESSSLGVNTVDVTTNYTLPNNIQNMVVIAATSGVTGNSLANYIVSNAPKITIDGGGGNDVITGAAGDSYRFDAKSGNDVITNFVPGARTSIAIDPETVQLNGYSQFTTFAQVGAAMTQVGSNVILQLDANDAIQFNNTTIAGFSADNFLLALPVPKASMHETFSGTFLTGLDASGSGLTSLWSTNYGWGGDPNALTARNLPGTGEKELFVDSGFVSNATGINPGINPFSITNGLLNIDASAAPTSAVASLYGLKNTSGMLSTRSSFTQTYGYFEASMKLPAGGGAWPAFWLYSANGNKTEIDIMESEGPDTWTATEHDSVSGTDIKGSTTIYTPDLSTSYNTFGLLWTPTTLTWYLNGVAVRSIATPPDLNGPMFMALDLALTNATPSTFTSADMSVAYVHAYSLSNLPSGVIGGAGATLNDVNGASTLTGGGGQDQFYVSRASTQVIETAGASATVTAAVNYTLPTNVAKLILTGAATQATSNAVGGTLIANNNGDTLISGPGKDTLIGGTGNDTFKVGTGQDILTGGGGHDTFMFGATIGYDVITDYSVANDTLNLSAFSNAAYTLSNSNGNAVLMLGNKEAITFDGVLASAIASSAGFHPSSISASGAGFSGRI